VKAQRLVLPFLVVGLVGSAGGWQLQERAARSLAEARAIQDAPIPEEDSAPPSPESNRAIIENLQRGTAIREKIDGVLTRVKASIDRLGEGQEAALDIAVRTKQLLREIAGSLGGSVIDSRTPVTHLQTLDGRLEESHRLGQLILHELAELDRKLGPPVGEP
jgi:hypothetical protein